MAILQYGIAAFTWDDAAGAFIAKPFSFHLLQRKSGIGLDGVDTNGWAAETPLVVQTGALEFLAHHGFDMNAVIHGGIGYTSREAVSRGGGG